MAAEKRDKLLSKIGLVDQCASEVGGGEWYAAIIQNVCIGKPYTQINAALIPTSKGNPFFKYRREFFALLDKTMDR